MFKQFSEHFAPHFAHQKNFTLNDLFADESTRYSHFKAKGAGLTLDFCRQPVTLKTLTLLNEFFDAAGFEAKIADLFNGNKINTSEQRAVLHTALRKSGQPPLSIQNEIQQELGKIQKLTALLHQKKWLSGTQDAITDVVHIGIGGSDLGPRMVVAALKPYHQANISVHFVANVDGSDIHEVLSILNPKTTLFIVASKSFSTQETLLNAETAKAWLTQHLKGAPLTQHFIAITANPAKAEAWGIPQVQIFKMWDFIGGRYSLWSSIGLPIAIQVGMQHFLELLEGAHELDTHFLTAQPAENIPVLLAFLSIMNQNFYGAESHAVLPYNHFLELLPAYLQQVDMESNGKSVTKNGDPIHYQTGVVLWGGVGTNSQHSFHQLLHQGTLSIPVDFILALKAEHPYQAQQDALIANCLAQAEALRCGNLSSEPAPAKAVLGNRPANIIFMEHLNPKNLGALIAAYEHKIFIQSLIWDINAFDQWGVELGKQLAAPLLKNLKHLKHVSVETLSELIAQK